MTFVHLVKIERMTISSFEAFEVLNIEYIPIVKSERVLLWRICIGSNNVSLGYAGGTAPRLATCARERFRGKRPLM